MPERGSPPPDHTRRKGSAEGSGSEPVEDTGQSPDAAREEEHRYDDPALADQKTSPKDDSPEESPLVHVTREDDGVVLRQEGSSQTVKLTEKEFDAWRQIPPGAEGSDIFGGTTSEAAETASPRVTEPVAKKPTGDPGTKAGAGADTRRAPEESSAQERYKEKLKGMDPAELKAELDRVVRVYISNKAEATAAGIFAMVIDRQRIDDILDQMGLTPEKKEEYLKNQLFPYIDRKAEERKAAEKAKSDADDSKKTKPDDKAKEKAEAKSLTDAEKSALEQELLDLKAKVVQAMVAGNEKDKFEYWGQVGDVVRQMVAGGMMTEVEAKNMKDKISRDIWAEVDKLTPDDTEDDKDDDTEEDEPDDTEDDDDDDEDDDPAEKARKKAEREEQRKMP